MILPQYLGLAAIIIKEQIVFFRLAFVTLCGRVTQYLASTWIRWFVLVVIYNPLTLTIIRVEPPLLSDY
jgi:hypothetical protein